MTRSRRAPKTPPYRPSFLRDWREYRGITLERAAESLKISHGQLSRIERGYWPYGQKLLEAAALFYRCKVVDLLAKKPRGHGPKQRTKNFIDALKHEHPERASKYLSESAATL